MTTIAANKAARLLGRKGGKARAEATTPEQRQEWARKGADAANAATTPEQRSERARKAAAARWAKRKRAASVDF